MTSPSFAEVAADINLWREWADPDFAVSDSEFESMTIEERVQLLKEVWGDHA